MSNRKFLDIAEVVSMIGEYPFITKIISGSNECLVFYQNRDADCLGNMLGNFVIDLLKNPDKVGFDYECRTD